MVIASREIKPQFYFIGEHKGTKSIENLLQFYSNQYSGQVRESDFSYPINVMNHPMG